LRFGGIPGSVIAFDFNGVRDTYYDAATPAALDAAPGRIWNVSEFVTTGYLKLGLKFDTQIPIHGNLGVQAVRAGQDSNGVDWVIPHDPITGDPLWDQGYPIGVDVHTSYTDILPSLNLIFDLPRDTYVRLGVARTLARPN